MVRWPWWRKTPTVPLWDSRPEWWRAVACHEVIKANLEYARVVAKGLKGLSEAQGRAGGE